MTTDALASPREVSPALTLTSAALAMFLLGAIYAYGVLLPAFMADFGWDRSTAALPQAVLLFVYAIGMGIGGALQDRTSPTRIAMLGGALFGMGMILAGYATTLWGLLIAYGVIAAIGFGFTYVAAVTAAMQVLPHRRGLAAGLVVGAFGLGALVWAPVTQRLLPTLEWSGILIAFGWLTLFTLPVLALGIRVPWRAHHAPGMHPGTAGLTLRAALHTRIFWTVFAAYTLATAVGLMLLAHIVNFGITLGIPAFTAALLLSAAAIGSGVGRVLMGALSDRTGRFPVLIGVSLLEIVLLIALAFTQSIGIIFLLATLTGFVFGSWLTLYGPTSTDLFGMRAAGAIYGVLYLSYGLGGLIGPTAGGWIADRTGAYQPAFLIGAIVSACAALLFVLAMRQHPPIYTHPPAREEEYPL